MLTCLVLAAGRGVRLKSPLSKALIDVGGKPVIYYSLRVLNNHPEVDNIIVVCNRDNIKRIERITKKYGFRKVKDFILGGKERKDSVLNAIKSVALESDYVLIHDAARPVLSKGLVSACIDSARKYGAAIAAVRVKPTIKVSESGKWIKSTLDRKQLWEAQTPQVFKKELINRGYRGLGNKEITDDSMLIERLGRKVRLVSGSYSNIKITTPEDLLFIRAIIKKAGQ